MSRQYVVLYSDPNDVSFLDTFRAALDAILENHDYYFVRSQFETVSDTLLRNIYTEKRRQITVSLVLDLRLQLRYLQVETELSEEAEKVVSWFKELLPVAPLSELQETADKLMREDPDSIVRLALGVGPKSDPVSLHVLRKGMSSQDELVRFRAVEAVSLTNWADFCPDIRRCLNDPSAEVRDMASHAEKACGCRDKLEPETY